MLSDNQKVIVKFLRQLECMSLSEIANILSSREIIDNRIGEYIGTQPVRVIHPMLILMFKETNPEFYEDLIKEINEGKIDRNLEFITGSDPIQKDSGFRTPRINLQTKKIELHESFLSYLWACTFAIYTNYIELVEHPRINNVIGKNKYPLNETMAEKAKELFQYARHIIVDFYAWDIENFPNPEKYQSKNRDYVEQTNLFYTEAVKFILCHEFTHLKKHASELTKETSNSQYLEYELEADKDAIEMIKAGITYSKWPLAVAHRLAVEAGIIISLLSMLYFSSETSGIRHPDAVDRLTLALEKLDDPEHPFPEAFNWDIACVGLKMWDEQFGKNYDWPDINLSSKERYYSIIEQIKKR